MVPISIVIITKNEAEVIGDMLNMAGLITDDIVIVDNGSTDGTQNIASAYGCRWYQNSWKGYGANKNIGIELAKYEWILSIDADEVPDMELVLALHDLKLDNAELVYDIRFRSYFGDRQIRFGSWGRGHHIRLFNRKLVKWSEQIVHETLIIPKQVKKKKIPGYVDHYSVKDVQECNRKAVLYARLSAEKYFQNGKEASLFNLLLSPVFSFFIGYILLLGFLDGKEGWNIARGTFKNKWLKYHNLNRMQTDPEKRSVYQKQVTIEY